MRTKSSRQSERDTQNDADRDAEHAWRTKKTMNNVLIGLIAAACMGVFGMIGLTLWWVMMFQGLAHK